MIYFKSCAKCGGDMHDSRDAYGSYLTCMSCGFLKDDPKDPSELTATIPAVPAGSEFEVKRAA